MKRIKILVQEEDYAPVEIFESTETSVTINTDENVKRHTKSIDFAIEEYKKIRTIFFATEETIIQPPAHQ